MIESKITRRNFLKVGAVASAAGLLSAAPVSASAADIVPQIISVLALINTLDIKEPPSRGVPADQRLLT